MRTILVARKPLMGNSIVLSVFQLGCGSINIEQCRISGIPKTPGTPPVRKRTSDHLSGFTNNPDKLKNHIKAIQDYCDNPPSGRWPANVLFEHNVSCTQNENDWVCSPGCQINVLNQEVGIQTTRNVNRVGESTGGGMFGHGNFQREAPLTYDQVKVAYMSRYFKQVRTNPT